MRDYIFHGKKTCGGDWIEGCYCNYQGVPQILTDDWSWEPVVPESVGQYTGMKDKHGRKIFEGDIVRCQERFDRPYSDKRKSKRHIGVVKYEVRGSHFDYEAKWIVEVKDYGKFVHGAWGDFYDCEVIGTVFENADLLEG